MSRSNCHWPPKDLVLWVPVSVGWLCFCLWTQLLRALKTGHQPPRVPQAPTPMLWTSLLPLVAPDLPPHFKTWWILVSGDFPTCAYVELWMGKPLYSLEKDQSPSKCDWRETRKDVWRGSLLPCPKCIPLGACVKLKTCRVVTCSVLC